MSGDPTVTNSVTELTPESVAQLISVLLAGLPIHVRRDAVSMAMGKLRTLSNTDNEGRIDIVPLPSVLPQDATVEQTARLWNGLMLLLLSLASSDGQTSVGTVTANAAALASGSPFASDPMVGERQNEVLLAKAILEAALLDDATAKKWFEDNNLAQALEQIVVASKAGRTDAEPIAVSAQDALSELYDCVMHEQPLGGDVLEGGALADFFSDTWANLKKGVGEAIQGLGTKVATRLGASSPSADVSGQAANGAVTTQTTADAAADASEAVSEELSAAKEAVAKAKAALDGGQANIAEYQAKLSDAALQNAKLQWAEAILNAPSDVAKILSAASPNMADPSSFLQSMLSTLSAAKATGNLGTIKAMLYALKAAASKGDTAADSLYSLITGDVSAIRAEDDSDLQYEASALNLRLMRQREELSALRQQLSAPATIPEEVISGSNMDES